MKDRGVKETAMKVLIKHSNHIPSASIVDYIHHELESLKPDLQIDEARIVLERRLHHSPAYRAAFHLVTPGPDVATEAEDHTLRAALLKSFNLIRDKITFRHTKRGRSRVEKPVTVSARRMATRSRSA